MSKQPILSTAISSLSKGPLGSIAQSSAQGVGTGGGLGGILSKIIGGAAGASPLGIGLSLIPTAAKFFTGMAQKNKARKINPVDPGFAANTGITDNARKVNDIYNNFSLPGRSSIVNNINSNMAGGMDVARQAASSSGDLLDASTKMLAGQNSAMTDLAVKEAEMKQNMLPMVLNANASAGNELVRKNEFDNQRYQAQLEEKAALNQSGTINKFAAGDDMSALGGSLLNYNTEAWSKPKIDPVMFKALVAKLNGGK